MRSISYVELPETASTNLYVSENLKQVSEGFLVFFTQNQTAGRGQGSNSWESEEGKNIAFSVVFHPKKTTPAEQFIISMAIAVDIVKQLRCDFPQEAEHFKTKWPNDIYWKDKKLGGILIENTLKGDSIDKCVIGIGLNINQMVFVSDAPNPVSLANILGESVNELLMMKRICERFFETYSPVASRYTVPSALSKDALYNRIRDDYHRFLFRNDNEYHAFEDANGKFQAKIIRVLNDGKLLLLTENGDEREYWLKEVRFLL